MIQHGVSAGGFVRLSIIAPSGSTSILHEILYIRTCRHLITFNRRARSEEYVAAKQGKENKIEKKRGGEKEKKLEKRKY